MATPRTTERKAGRDGSNATSWQRVANDPERWERPGFGAIEARSADLWAILPTCGHSYGALTLIDAQRHLEEHDGLCFVCWYRTFAFRRALRRGSPTPPEGTPFD